VATPKTKSAGKVSSGTRLLYHRRARPIPNDRRMNIRVEMESDAISRLCVTLK